MVQYCLEGQALKDVKNEFFDELCEKKKQKNKLKRESHKTKVTEQGE